MTEVLLAVLTTVFVASIVLLVGVWIRVRRTGAEDPAARFDAFERLLERNERGVREEIARNREEVARRTQEQREELTGSLQAFAESVQGQMASLGAAQKGQLDSFSRQLQGSTTTTEERLERMRQGLDARLQELATAVDGKLAQIQQDNEKRLDQMRATVEEKLQGTLEQRLGESFRTVSAQLEQVHKGLGEMQTLATGVGDLKRVLSNVKMRGTWGEVQLASLLEQVLVPDQYGRNVVTKKGSTERVEFAVKLPGRADDGEPVWMPLDAKFPVEDYQRLQDAADRGDAAAVEAAARQLEARITAAARDIHDKYLDPPHTTDFGVMFLPTEGLYAEVLRRPGLAEHLQRDWHVAVAGPTTLLAILNTLQMGFRTLAIEKRSAEVWRVLGAVKTEFAKFGDVLDRVGKKLTEASNSIEAAAQRRRAMERKLREVEALPVEAARDLLPPVPEAAEVDED